MYGDGGVDVEGGGGERRRWDLGERQGWDGEGWVRVYVWVCAIGVLGGVVVLGWGLVRG